MEESVSRAETASRTRLQWSVQAGRGQWPQGVGWGRVPCERLNSLDVENDVGALGKRGRLGRGEEGRVWM